jgi:23S rRNA (cytidine1920-2'-O)/16S rRNA (cytidine1409-2'-O)-methyltransferase
VDVSFISLALILPPLLAVVGPGADLIALVKPQFEAGRRDAPKGVVRDPDVHARVQADVTAKAAAIGWARLAVTSSPIVGAKGNREFLMHFTPGPRP